MTFGRGTATRLHFATTLFLGAALLFCVEPMVAKMLMPLLGGAPAVWITCMLFFQAVLLLGYGYAHVTTAWLGVRRQAALHLAVLALPLLVLPIHVRAAAATLLSHRETPALPLLGVLAGVVGLPFFVVGATAPLLQKWFSRIGMEDGADPYFLYGASNFGSLLSLAAYPILIEPWVGLADQSRLWTWGYGVLAAFVAVAAVTAIVRGRRGDADSITSVAPGERITFARRARWVFYAFVPSSLLLGVTAYITTDLAPIPLLWLVPLAIYLTTFILVFAKRPPLAHSLMVRVLPFGVTATVMMLIVQASTPMPVILLMHLGAFFVAAMVCHGELAKDRPDSQHLTEFYLWVSVGGVLGGVVNGLLAPSVFDRLLEYPIAVVLAAACRRVPGGTRSPVRRDWAFALGIFVLTLGVVLGGRALHLDTTGHLFPLLFAVPLLLGYAQLASPWRYTLALVATLLGASSYDASVGQTIHRERSFFGIVRVARDLEGRFTQIAHGNTIHGRQRRDSEHRDDPTAYYTRIGPLGQVFDELYAREATAGKPARVAVVGLGAGAMASYARPFETWTYYEIDPIVVRIATDPTYFTFLADAFEGTSRLRIVLGDARVRLEEEPDGSCELLVIDAFSSDAIPAHLLTREAFALYRRKLTPHGLLVAHISNRYLDLYPVLSNLATDAGMDGFIRRDHVIDDAAAALAVGWTASDWVMLVEHGNTPRALAADARWQRFAAGERAPWTDDFSDLVRAFHF